MPNAALAALTEPGSMSQRIEMYNKNTLKIGLFGANCSSARTATLVPERWQATWPDCLKMARIADERGIDFLLRSDGGKVTAATAIFMAPRLRPLLGPAACSPPRNGSRAATIHHTGDGAALAMVG